MTYSRHRARFSDPDTSHDAAEEITASGLADSQKAAVLAGMRAHPGLTSRELATQIGLDRYAAARRTAELKNEGRAHMGEARRCTQSHRKARRWYAGLGPTAGGVVSGAADGRVAGDTATAPPVKVSPARPLSEAVQIGLFEDP